MKQQLLPTRKYIGDSRWPQTEADAAADFEGMDNWHLGIDTDTCKFYYQLVSPDYMRAKYGPKKLAIEGGWVVDLPPVPSGYYSVQTPIYYTYFHQKDFQPLDEDGNAAHDLWAGTEYHNLLGDDVPYTWTNEDILFSLEDYDYDEIMELGDKLLPDGNIAKAADADDSAVGTVRWIAYAPAPWLSTTAYEYDRSHNWFSYYYLYDKIDDNGYRAFGKEDITGNGVRYLTIDYEKHGCSTLDEFWRTDVCNHYLAFSSADVTYKETVLHNDPIFNLVLPTICHNGQGMYDYTYMGDGWSIFVAGTMPELWVYEDNEWQLNDDNESGIRSTDSQAASIFNGPGILNGVSWKVPTSAEYYVGNYQNTSIELNYLTCNYLKSKTTGADNEGIVALHSRYGFTDFAPPTSKFVYFGDGNVHDFSGPRNSYLTRPFSPHPIARATISVNSDVTINQDKLFIHNPDDGSQSEIDVPSIYRPCIAF